MPRLQILELPEGAGDRRAPFVLVVDEYQPQRVIVGPGTVDPWRDQWSDVAQRIGAQGVLVFPDTVEIPANQVPVGPDGYPVRLAVTADPAGFHEDVADAINSARVRAEQEVQGGHRFGGPGFNDPVRCSACGHDKAGWDRGDRRTCAFVRDTARTGAA